MSEREERLLKDVLLGFHYGHIKVESHIARSHKAAFREAVERGYLHQIYELTEEGEGLLKDTVPSLSAG